MEILLDKLVNKGILTKSEADGLLKEMKETKEMENKKIEVEKTKTEEEKPKIEPKEIGSPEWVENQPDWIVNPPDWIKNMKFAGDLRLRYRDEDIEGSPERNRGRLRWRVGQKLKLWMMSQ